MENIRVMLEGSNFYTFLIVLVALMGVFVLIGNVIKTIKELKKPEENLHEKINDLVSKVETHDVAIDEIKETNQLQCQAVKALLNHAIHNGNADEMASAANALDKYLIKKM